MSEGDELSAQSSASPLGEAMHIANRVMFSIRRNEVKSANLWGKRLLQLKTGTLFLAYGHVLPRLLIAEGNKGDAAKELVVQLDRATRADALSEVVRIRVYQALAASTQAEALGFIGHALRIAEPEGFVRTFVDEGTLLKALLVEAVAKGMSVQYASGLIRTIDAEEAGSQARFSNKPRVLSEREIEVLRLIAAGLSNRQIASRLVITLSTAKTHVHNISRKLEVSTRTQIVAKAKELDVA